MSEGNRTRAKIRSKESLYGLEHPLLARHGVARAICCFPIEELFRNLLERPLGHLSRCRFDLLDLLRLLFQEFLPESKRLSGIVGPGGLSVLFAAVIAPLEPNEGGI
jgi:hypothetical protein